MRASSKFVGRLVRQRTNRSAFQWEKAVFPYTPKEVTTQYKQWDQTISSMKSKTGVPKPIEEIDWNHWRSVITTPGAVDKLKAEYESHKIQDVKVEGVEAFNSQVSKKLKRAQLVADWSASEIETAKKEVELKIYERDNWQDLDDEEVMDLYPGLREQTQQRFWNGNELSDWLEDRVNGALPDTAELRKLFNSGQPIALPEGHDDLYSFGTYLEPDKEIDRLNQLSEKFDKLSGQK